MDSSAYQNDSLIWPFWIEWIAAPCEVLPSEFTVL